MLSMSKIENIKDLWMRGNNVSDISRITSTDRKTVRKYIDKTDFNEDVVSYIKIARPSKLDPYKETIERWLLEEETWYHKQKYTAKRIQKLLITQKNATELKNSYQTIARYVKQLRKERRRQGNVIPGTLRLYWSPGEAQADFGVADCYIDGKLKRTKYFVLIFPYSNKALSVFMPGENCECVCRALQMIFEYIGHVPTRIVFDNATGIGRRVAKKLQENENFVRFRMHYGFIANYANPESGWEKGCVENAVGTIRSNLMVPPLDIEGDMETYDLEYMLPESYEFRDDKILCDKTRTSGELFKDDIKAMSPINPSVYEVRHIRNYKLNRYGELVLEEKHKYACGSAHHDEPVLVEKTAWKIYIYDLDGMMLKEFERSYAEDPTITYDMESMLKDMVHKPNSWNNSFIRRDIESGPFKSYMDCAEGEERVRMLSLLNSATEKYDFGMAITAMNDLLGNGKVPGLDALFAMCNRLQDFPATTSVNPTNVDLSNFDALMAGGF